MQVLNPVGGSWRGSRGMAGVGAGWCLGCLMIGGGHQLHQAQWVDPKAIMLSSCHQLPPLSPTPFPPSVPPFYQPSFFSVVRLLPTHATYSSPTLSSSALY